MPGTLISKTVERARSPTTISDAVQHSWRREARRGFLNTATVGLPPRAGPQALQAHITRWQDGQLIAAVGGRRRRPLPSGVRAPGRRQRRGRCGRRRRELVRRARRGVAAVERHGFSSPTATSHRSCSRSWSSSAAACRCVRVALEEIVDAIDAQTDIVAVSAAQSADGRVIDLDALAAAARHHGADVLLDATQAAGWMAIDAVAVHLRRGGRVQVVPVPARRRVHDRRRRDGQRLMAHHASWYAGRDPWESIYGTPLRLAPGARRLDMSPAWACWCGGAPALELLAERGPVGDRCSQPSARRPPAPRARPRAERQRDRQRRRPRRGGPARRGGRAGATRAGNARVSFHLYNDEQRRRPRARRAARLNAELSRRSRCRVAAPARTA